MNRQGPWSVALLVSPSQLFNLFRYFENPPDEDLPRHHPQPERALRGHAKRDSCSPRLKLTNEHVFGSADEAAPSLAEFITGSIQNPASPVVP